LQQLLTRELLSQVNARRECYVGEDVTVRTDRRGWNAIAMTNKSSASGTVAQYDSCKHIQHRKISQLGFNGTFNTIWAINVSRKNCHFESLQLMKNCLLCQKLLRNSAACDSFPTNA